MMRAFSGLLRPGGRLLVVASDFGTLTNLPKSLHNRFDTDVMNLDDVDAAMTSPSRTVVSPQSALVRVVDTTYFRP